MIQASLSTVVLKGSRSWRRGK